MPLDLPPSIICEAPRAIDGDTIRCANIARPVRLAGIDAPELPGHCRRGRVCTPGDPYAAKAALAELLDRGIALVWPQAVDRYGRPVARVTIGGTDASCALLATGFVVERYGRITCPS